MNKNLWTVLIMILSLTLASPAVFADQAAEERAQEAVTEVSAALQTETAEKFPDADPPLEEIKTVSEVWLQTPPVVKVSPFGQEIKINVNFDSEMGKEKTAAIQSVKLETDKGEFLGLKTYSPEETSREAEFMVSPEILKIDKVKIIVSSLLDGEYSTEASLVIPQEEPKAEASAPSEDKKTVDAAPEIAAAKAEAKPKKKGWGW